MGIEREKSSPGATLPLSLQPLGYPIAAAPSTAFYVAAHGQEERWHGGTVGIAVPWAWRYHRHHGTQGGFTHGQILQSGWGSGKITFEFTPGNWFACPCPRPCQNQLFQLSQTSWNHLIQFCAGNAQKQLIAADFCKAALSIEGFSPRRYYQQLWVPGHLPISFFLMEKGGGDLRAVSHCRSSSDSGETVILSSPALGKAPDAPLPWPRR